MSDYFNKVISGTTRPVATTLAAQKLSGATGATLVATTGWDTGTKVHGIMYRTDAGTGLKVAGSQIDWKATVSGTSLTNFAVTAGTDDTYAIGTTVELAPTAAWGDDIATGILVDHSQTGTHVMSTNFDPANPTLETQKWAGVASAVNELTVTNSITATPVTISATGDDANVDLYARGKGTGVAHVENPEILSSHVASGGVIAISSGLIGTFSNIVYYISGRRYKKTSVANKTYTASRDTYVDIDTAGTITYVEAANGATSGMTLTANSVRVAKVVTSGAAITSITQSGTDPLNNLIYPQNSNAQIVTHIRYETNATVATPTTNTAVGYNKKIYDTLSEWNSTTFRFTPTKPGLYAYNAQMWFGSAGASTTESAEISARTNGTTVINASDRMNGSGDATRLLRPKVLGATYLNVGDYLEMINNSTNAVRDITSSVSTYVEIHRID